MTTLKNCGDGSNKRLFVPPSRSKRLSGANTTRRGLSRPYCRPITIKNSTLYERVDFPSTMESINFSITWSSVIFSSLPQPEHPLNLQNVSKYICQHAANHKFIFLNKCPRGEDS